MKPEQWNRKEENPVATVDRIRGILQDIGIDCQVVDNKNYENMWASSRVEIKGLWGVGSNGKGIDTNFTMASAYAELIERIQGGVLLHQYFPNLMIHERPCADVNAFCEKLSIISGQNSIIDRDLVEKIINLAPEYSSMQEYSRLADGSKELLPEKMIIYLAGSNGLCAGNTYCEAYCQGISEVMERFVHKRIFAIGHEDDQMKFATIPEEYYINTYSYHLIKEIQNRGYVCYVKDCSLGGKYPVVGLLVMDKQKRRYIFRLGADLYFDLALQRAITEIFQGIEFDYSFKYSMQNLYSTEDNSVFEYNDPRYSQVPSISSGTGILPYWLFIEYDFTNVNLAPFVFTQPTNEKAAVELTRIAKAENMDIYIRDCGFLGFPTIRIFSPEVSDVYNFGMRETLESIVDLCEFRRAIREKNSVNLQYAHLRRLIEYPTYAYNLAMSKLSGIIVSDEKYSYMEQSNLYVATLALKVHDYESARQLVKKHYQSDIWAKGLELSIALLFIGAKSSGLNDEKIKKVFDDMSIDYHKNEFIQFYFHVTSGGDFVYCDNCTQCDHRIVCAYHKHNQIMEVLNQKECAYKSYNNEEYNSLITRITLV